MSEKKQQRAVLAVLDAAREVADIAADIEAGFGSMPKLLDAIRRMRSASWSLMPPEPADASPASEVVRSVDDLRDGDTVLLWDQEWWVRAAPARPVRLLTDEGAHLPDAALRLAIAAGAVARPPVPEPDPAEVERLGCYLQRRGVHVEADVVKGLLRAGLLYPAEAQP